MKKLIFTCIIALAIISCSKETSEITPSNNSQSSSITKDNSFNSKSGEPEVKYIPETTFEEDLEDYMQEILEENPNTPIMFNLIHDENTSTFAVTNEPSPIDPINAKYKIICRGDFGAVENVYVTLKDMQ